MNTQNEKTIKPQTKEELLEIIQKKVHERGVACSLNHIDVSNVTDMGELFRDSPFIGNISEWNMGQVVRTDWMFHGAAFNGDISRWDVSNVKNMDGMFCRSQFNGDISQWNTENVQYMFQMFISSAFNGDISKWKISQVKDMQEMFENAVFEGDLRAWGLTEEELYEVFGDKCEHYLSVRKSIEENAKLKELNGVETKRAYSKKTL
jgi:hypothetical protein